MGSTQQGEGYGLKEPKASETIRDSTYNQGNVEFLSGEQQQHFQFTDEQLNSMEEVRVQLEEPWTNRTEEVLCDWQAEAESTARDHNKAGYRLKFKYRLLNFVLLVWASIILVVNGLLQCDDYISSRVILLVANAIQVFLVGLNGSLNLAVAYRLHFEYEAKYSGLALDIDHMLARDRDFRVPADAFLTEIRERKKHLADAPELPQSQWFFC